MFRRIFNLAFVLIATTAMAACGSLSRPEGPLRLGPQIVERVEDPRISAHDSEKLRALAADMARRISSDRPHRILALSGGGANGAYGAGIIVGWTERGDRPVFDVVTGVSTGALAAPFAFLGSEWDDELRAAYTDGQAQSLLSARGLSVFRTPSLFNNAALRRLVDGYVTPELLTAIAAEHLKGRRLMVATTNLDAEETVIWDMGVLAGQGAPAVQLFKDVLIASASIPGVFPPMLIGGVNDQGEVIMDMHVDGGVNTPFLAIPEDLLLWTNPHRQARQSALYVVVNGQIGRNAGVTSGRLSGILTRTFDSMSKASLRTALAATGAFADRNGIAMSVTAIPDNVNASSLKFDAESMRALFELARQRSVSGEAWAPVRPSDDIEFVSPTTASDEQIPDVLKPAAPILTPSPN